ncbi:aspartate-semialdehyde dehydrogenase [Taibaiella sp. KBW10]|uniref:aspartate-semialdehyde dehydrogenase n=1 Tax=Taibaiella sp. KBW10 TaxID=2153357 RepID=UPI000F5A15A7|nr:aspartate-semialdehyde dehydrogenase [Taibaiella sp. KBW10]RQO30062.1 aspartate-semialdehyde dehydrogenase [Taibaiella sp. KBW10]
MKVAVVGATGLVGSTMLQILAERNFPISTLIPIASDKSKGKLISFKGKEYPVVTLAEGLALQPDIALFSAGGSTSLAWAEKFAAVNCFVIDNSSAWRMDPDKKLVVPEVNGHVLTKEDKIIANPNCSTIQMVMVLQPLHQLYHIKRVVVSTYQSVTGSGQKGVDHLEAERAGTHDKTFYPHQIDLNVIPHIDVFMDNGYTKEEIKMILETQKIMGDDQIQVTATAVRVPVMGGHSESVNITFEKDFELDRVKTTLEQAPGITLLDDVQQNSYPMPIHACGKDEVFVGRIRRDHSFPNTLNCWIVADNLRKGAATNAVQIAEYLIVNHLV